MKRLIALLLALLLLTGAGCGRNNEPPAPTPEAAETPVNTEAPGPVSVSGPELDDDTFTLLYASDDTLNPYSCRTERSRELCPLLYETLVSVTPDFQAEPRLCSEWDSKDGGGSYFLTLRSGARFSDGSEVRTWDVIYSLNRARESGFYASRLRCVTDVTQSGGCVVITLDTPNPCFPLRLDIPVVKEGSAYADEPVGSGPYVFQAEGSRILLRKNTCYPDAAKLPCEEIALVDYKDESVLGAFQQGKVDMLTEMPGERRQSMSSIVRHSFPTTVLNFLLADTQSASLGNSARRRLVSAALDRDEIAGLLNGDPTLLPLHPLLPEYDAEAAQALTVSDWDAYCIEVGTEDYNGDGYLEYLQGGSQTRFSVRVAICSDREYSAAVGQSIEGSLRGRGIAVTLLLCNEEEFRSAMEQHSCDLYLLSIRLTTDFDLTELFQAYDDTVLQELAARLRSTGGRTRKKAASALCTRCMESCAVIPLAFSRGSIDTRIGSVSGAEPGYSDLFRNFTGWDLRELRTAEETEENT